MFLLWIFGVFVIGSFAAYYLGQMNSYDQKDFAFLMILSTLGWPVVLILTIIVAPFAIPFILGARKKNKKND